MKLKFKPKMSVWRYLALGYLCVVLVGSLLLVLPFSAREQTSYLNAFFTSVSATCVTGLVVYDTALHWTAFGQVVILCLIQLGGLGFTTIVSILFMLARRGELGLYERRVVMQSYGMTRLKGVGTLVKRIVIGTLSIELFGAALLCIRFVPDYGAIGVYYSLFHAVSAFCNAGFDVLGRVSGEFASLGAYYNDPLVLITLGLLIVIGGLGFCVWGDVFDCKFRVKRFQFYTKFILLANTVLLVVSTALFLVFERGNAAYGSDFGTKLLNSFFSATTARTAGFAATPVESLSESGYLLTVVLMFIGGSSGSTAGGIKVSTFAVILMGMFANLRGQRNINLGKRRLDTTLVGQALAIFTFYLMTVLMATFIILAIEPETAFSAVLFETVSAIGTVGLSMSLTPTLCAVSKIILILLMYTGRVGVLTLAFALRRKNGGSEGVRKPLIDTLYIG